MSPVSRLVSIAALAVLVSAGLAGCGKKGAPEAPGPGDQVTYPRTYPTE